MPTADRPGRILVISPHLDDAVLACGALLACHPGAMVLTVFAGTPRHSCRTEWDRACGFADAQEAMAARRAEDEAALALLNAEPLWLPFCDHQYGEPVTARDVAPALDAVILEHAPQAVLLPLGLFHSDHALAHEAALLAWLNHAARDWLAYEDAMYRRIPGLLHTRLQALAAQGIEATPWCGPDLQAQALAETRKREAVRRYASQLRGLTTPGRPGYDDARAPERCWRLARRAEDRHA